MAIKTRISFELDGAFHTHELTLYKDDGILDRDDLPEAMLERKESITSVMLGDGIQSIADRGGWVDKDEEIVFDEKGVFYGFYALKSVTFPTGFIKIGCCAFSGCVSLIDLSIPETCIEFGIYCFCDCASLESITIPKDCIGLPDGVFDRCYSLATVHFQGTCPFIGDFAFKGCKITKLTIPKGCVSLGSEVVSENEALIQITLPETLTEILDFAFSECEAITELIIPASCVNVGADIIDGCLSLSYLIASAQMIESFRQEGILPNNCIVMTHDALKAALKKYLDVDASPDDIDQCSDHICLMLYQLLKVDDNKLNIKACLTKNIMTWQQAINGRYPDTTDVFNHDQLTELALTDLIFLAAACMNHDDFIEGEDIRRYFKRHIMTQYHKNRGRDHQSLAFNPSARYDLTVADLDTLSLADLIYLYDVLINKHITRPIDNMSPVVMKTIISHRLDCAGMVDGGSTAELASVPFFSKQGLFSHLTLKEMATLACVSKKMEPGR